MYDYMISSTCVSRCRVRLCNMCQCIYQQCVLGVLSPFLCVCVCVCVWLLMQWCCSIMCFLYDIWFCQSQTLTHTYIYIYIYIYVCVCVCVWTIDTSVEQSRTKAQNNRLTCKQVATTMTCHWPPPLIHFVTLHLLLDSVTDLKNNNLNCSAYGGKEKPVRYQERGLVNGR